MRVGLLRAPNAGLFTGSGTNTWLIESDGQALIVDPGPLIDDHLATIRFGIGDLDPVAVVVTHTHPDHAPAANVLADGLGVPAYGCGPGPGFSPDLEIGDGELIRVGEENVAAVHTPGHAPDHLCYLVQRALFSGDHIMEGSTVIVEHMTDYMDSLHRLKDMDLEMIYPGHGDPIKDPAGVLDHYVAHRETREAQILEAVRDGARSLGEVVLMVYTDVDTGLHGGAAISTGAHLRKLICEGLVVAPMGTDDWAAPVAAAPDAPEV